MLVVTRGIGESIMIGDDIIVSVQRVTGGVVRIGVEAPKDALILRSEMLTRPQPLGDSGPTPRDERL